MKQPTLNYSQQYLEQHEVLELTRESRTITAVQLIGMTPADVPSRFANGRDKQPSLGQWTCMDSGGVSLWLNDANWGLELSGKRLDLHCVQGNLALRRFLNCIGNSRDFIYFHPYSIN